MKTVKFLALILALASIVACKKELVIDDGRIPAEYLPMVQEYLGTYSGKTDRSVMSRGDKGTLQISLVGDRLKISFEGTNGDTDILNNDCNSLIGNLLSLRGKVKNDEIKLTDATLEFYPNRCRRMIRGRDIKIFVRKKHGVIRLDTAILLFVTYKHDDHGSWGGGGIRADYHYQYGRFYKD